MNRRTALSSVLGTLSLCLLTMGVASAQPTTMTYSGALYDAEGEPFDGEAQVVARIFDEAGSLRWQETHEFVDIAGGVLRLELGIQDGINDGTDFGGDGLWWPSESQLYLELEVDGDTLSPRQRITAVPYAFTAHSAGGALSDRLVEIESRLRAVESGRQGTGWADLTDTPPWLADGRCDWDDIVGVPDDLADGDDVGLEAVVWGDIQEIPGDIADGDQVGEGDVLWSDIIGHPDWLVDGHVSWDEVLGRPAGLDDGDDVGVTAVAWGDVTGRPAGLDDGDDVGLTSVAWSDVTSRPAGLDDGDDVGVTAVAWGDVTGRPAGLDDGDDVGLTSVAWNQIQDIPSDIADGDQVGEGTVSWSDLADVPGVLADGFVAWEEIRDRPAGLDDGDDVGLTAVAWTDVASRPAGLDDGDDVGLTSVAWGEVRDRPTGLDDGDDVGLTSVDWTDVRNRPTGLDDGDDVGLRHVTWTDITHRPDGLDDGDDVGLRNVNWLDVRGRPDGLDDGDDVGLESVSWDEIREMPSDIASFAGSGHFFLEGSTFTFNAVNVAIRDGSGTTEFEPGVGRSGFGNLIIGYNEEVTGDEQRSGNHNLVVGPGHSYTAAGSVISGRNHSASAHYAALLGGFSNTVDTRFGVAVGGFLSHVTAESSADVAKVNIGGASLVSGSVRGSVTLPTLSWDQIDVPDDIASFAGTNGFYRVGDEFYFNGVNVNIRSGQGGTFGEDYNSVLFPGTPNGLGNLVVGYNEGAGFERSGSHNLVVGPYHSYEGHGGLVSGAFNTLRGEGNSVLGGYAHQSVGYFSVAMGGVSAVATKAVPIAIGTTWDSAPSSDAPDLNATMNGMARLVGGASEGRLEVFHEGEWGNVCGDGFDHVDATVACRQLGYRQGQFTATAGDNPVTWIRDMQCDGDEPHLMWCRAELWDAGTCEPWDAVHIACSNPIGASE